MHCIWYQDCGAATRSCAAGSIREGGDRVPEKTDKWFIVTLVRQMGKEEAAKDMLREIEKEIAPKGAEIVSWSNGQSEHYHILGRKEDLDRLALEKWPGAVKRHDITESQAGVVIQHHTKYCPGSEGLRQEKNCAAGSIREGGGGRWDFL